MLFRLGQSEVELNITGASAVFRAHEDGCGEFGLMTKLDSHSPHFNA